MDEKVLIKNNFVTVSLYINRITERNREENIKSRLLNVAKIYHRNITTTLLVVINNHNIP